MKGFAQELLCNFQKNRITNRFLIAFSLSIIINIKMNTIRKIEWVMKREVKERRKGAQGLIHLINP